MQSVNFFFLKIIIAFVVFGCSNETADTETGSPLEPSKYYEELNISYGNDNNQVFDLFLPANRNANTKILILVHGGGWTSGDKSSMNAIRDLIRQDFPDVAIANINYRLADSNNSPYPMQINDITSVVDFLKANKTNYNVSEKLGFIGTSAGAHLSLLWSYAFDTNNNVNMVCSIVGPTNFTDPAYLENANPELQNLLNLYGLNPNLDFLEEISPYHQVTTSSPPTILFYAGQDELIPTTQGTDMRDKLSDLDIIHEFTLYPNVGHSLGVLEIIDAWNKLKTFISNQL
ncbi:alpha/beta hydrolase [Tamlana sp. 2201CG12-4]|uniref:alpha/beta hydrolase n=1 Tax=Tamlana sp. 2201CG12-4 TaxID=3112582 RepID=UPI002DBE1453|nr:alpha/beta hydrolase [Tamlana sp. 2201CG12-4]MEC3907946.1 alpha/beta hydrolase [Tamlana sp. 2201CG12-4]